MRGKSGIGRSEEMLANLPIPGRPTGSILVQESHIWKIGELKRYSIFQTFKK